MKKTGILMIGILMLGLLSACDLLTPAEPTPMVYPTLAAAVCPTEIPLPTMEPTIALPTSTPAPTATPAPVSMVSAAVKLDNFSLRSGPSRLFERIEQYTSGDVVNIFGREATNTWMLVTTEDYRTGWMRKDGLDVQGDTLLLPIYNVENAHLLRGHVYLADQTPAYGVGLHLSPAADVNGSRYDEAETNASGEWVFYIPLSEKGEWVVGPNSVTCANTNAAVPTGPESCEIIGNMPFAQTVTLPYTTDVSIEFMMLAAQ